MKIVIIIDSIDITKGGTSRSSTEVIDILSMQNDNLEILLLSKNSKNPIVRSFKHSNARLSLNSNILSAIYFNWKFIRKCDVIHIQGLWSFFPAFIGIMVKILVRPILIVSPRGMLEEWSLNQSKRKKLLALRTYQGYLLKNADYVHVTSSTEETNVLKLFPKARTKKIPNGINCNEFLTTHAEKSQKIKTILFLSRIHPKKGIELLIESWGNLEFLWCDWRICIIGDGESEYIESLQKRIDSMALASISINEPLYGLEKIKAYQSSDLFVLPTYSENFGIVVAEALASGLPVITTNGTPWSEISEKNIGEIINPSSEELTEALLKWTKYSSNERAIAGKKGQELVLKSYDLQKVASTFMNLYKNSL